jgi:hypothetical protein
VLKVLQAMKLSGWKRIGIIASVVWMIGAGICTLIVLDEKDRSTAEFFYAQCAKIRDEGRQNQSEYCWKASERKDVTYTALYDKCMKDYEAKNPDHCTADELSYFHEVLPGERIVAAIVGVVPVPFAWGFVYLVLFLVRWVKRGFNT